MEIEYDNAKQHPVCKYCKSDKVYIDAWAEWDYDSQQWDLHSTYDNAYCKNCEGETKLEWIDEEKYN